MPRGRPGLATVELALALLFVFMVIAIKVVQARPHVETFGRYAIVVTWPAGRDDDVDLYVRDPDGSTVYYAALDGGQMHLEHDDLGFTGSGYQRQANFERVVLRGIVPGEYVANVHLYRRGDTGPVPVVVKLWRLQGDDRVMLTRLVELRADGDEETAFRFTLGTAGTVTGSNRLPLQLVRGGSP